jgi:hypothetical protein
MIKAYHVIAPHFVHDSLSVVAVRVVHLHGQFERVFSLLQILRMPFTSDDTRPMKGC